ncbi:MAG: helix-turn-helix domain-containing protein [Cyanobacteria bacterium J06635_15]
MSIDDQSNLLRQLMQRVDIASYRGLSRQAGVSQWQITQLRRGNLAQMRLEPLLQISQTLSVSLDQLIAALAPKAGNNIALISQDAPPANLGIISQPLPNSEDMASSQEAVQSNIHDSDLRAKDARIEALTQEYTRLQTRYQQQQATLEAKFRMDSLQQLESWLTYWPTATHAVQQGQATVSPENLIRLVRPVELLIAAWGVQPIGTVGETVAFDPQLHQLVGGTAQPGDEVRIKTVGYWREDKLLFRAKCVLL